MQKSESIRISPEKKRKFVRNLIFLLTCLFVLANLSGCGNTLTASNQSEALAAEAEEIDEKNTLTFPSGEHREETKKQSSQESVFVSLDDILQLLNSLTWDVSPIEINGLEAAFAHLPVDIHGIYSPSISPDGLKMTAGLALKSKLNKAYGDEIILAQWDGEKWVYKKELIKPVNDAYVLPLNQIPDGTETQYNDSELIKLGNRLVMLYTATVWPYECGSIKMAVLDENYTVVGEPATLFDGQGPEFCNDVQKGMSRPSVEKTRDGKYIVWADSSGKVYRFDPGNFSSTLSSAQQESITGLDLEVIETPNGHLVLKSGAFGATNDLDKGIQAMYFDNANKQWYGPFAVTHCPDGFAYDGSPKISVVGTEVHLIFARFDYGTQNTLPMGHLMDGHLNMSNLTDSQKHMLVEFFEVLK